MVHLQMPDSVKITRFYRLVCWTEMFYGACGAADDWRLAGSPTPVLGLQDLAAFGQMLVARIGFFFMLFAVMGNGISQPLLLGVAIFTAQLRVFA
jgi:hypothetical protein